MGVGTNSGANLTGADLTGARLAAAVFPARTSPARTLTGLHPNDDASLDMRLRLANAVLADANLTGARWISSGSAGRLMAAQPRHGTGRSGLTLPGSK
jgi:uncharacterized protein YjbI with pentapeptide repeats